MKRTNLLMSLTLAGALSTLGSQAHATSWMDFDDGSTPPPSPLSADSQNPTIINEVTVVCPATGFLVARANSTAFLRNLTGQQKLGAFLRYSISLDRKSALGNDAIVFQNLGPNTFANVPASVQRVDACNAGETRTYYHTVHGSAGEGNVVATESRNKLVVEFFDTRI